MISAPNTSEEAVEISETDTPAEKTMTVLQSARPGTNTSENNSQSIYGAPQEVVNPEVSVGSSDGTDVNVYCEDKLRSLSECEIQTLVDVIANILGDPLNSERVVGKSIRVAVVGDLEEGGQEYLNWTPMKSASGVENVADSLRLPSESPLKRSAGVAFVISEEEELMFEVAQSGKGKKKSNDGDGSRMATSTGGLTTEIGLSENDEMIGQGPLTIRANVSMFWEISSGIELPPREKLVGNAKVCQGSEICPCQPAKI